MPWTPRQVRYLMSKASPLTGEQQASMGAELHADPSLGHKRKGVSKPHIDKGNRNIRNGKSHTEKLRHG